MAPSPTAEATRLLEQWRTSPATNTPGSLDSQQAPDRVGVDVEPAVRDAVSGEQRTHGEHRRRGAGPDHRYDGVDVVDRVYRRPALTRTPIAHHSPANGSFGPPEYGSRR